MCQTWKIGHDWKMGHTWKMCHGKWATFKKCVTLKTICHSRKNGWHFNKCVTVGKWVTLQECISLERISHT